MRCYSLVVDRKPPHEARGVAVYSMWRLQKPGKDEMKGEANERCAAKAGEGE